MQVTLTHHTNTRKSLEIHIPAAEVTSTFGEALSRIAPKVKLPGFRPGKVPKNVLLSRYAREIRQDVADLLVQRLFWDAAAAAGTQPISQPALEKADLADGKDGSIKTLYDVAPEVKLPEYKGLKLTKKKRAIDDAAVEEHLEAMRQQAAKLLPEDGVSAEGLYATFDIKAKPAGLKAQTYRDQVIQLDPKRPFDAEVLGLKVDESRAFEITVPVDDPNKTMAGKKVHYEVTLKDLRKHTVPELNDEFAKDMGDYADLKALRTFVRKELEEAAERDAHARLQSTVLETLLDAAPFEVPVSMVSLQLDDYSQEFANLVSRQGIDPRRVNWNAYRQTRLRDAERAVRSGYLLQTIGNAEDIQVSDEEIDADIRTYMEENKVQEPFAAFKTELEGRGATTEIKGRIRTDKIFDALIATASVTEELLDKQAFEELVELERKRDAGLASARFDAGGLESGETEQDGGDPESVK
ncbi:MAG: trigger factor, partial [Acidobacteriota bacterium]|nr:trigger factor [Acidobacteriota bacterium]